MKVVDTEVDVEADAPPCRKIRREGQHSALQLPEDEGTRKMLGGCVGLFGLGGFIGLMILLCSIHTLGPEEQVVIEGADGKYVINGPQKVVLSPSRKKTFREASRLGPREYAVIKNTRSGEPRHEEGPKLLWMEAYDELVAVKSKVVLQLQEYIRLVDMTGAERVVVGPQILVPKPLESSPNGTEKAIVLAQEITVLTMNKTTGLRRLINTEGVFSPQPYELILEVRTATLLSPKQYALVKDTITGKFRHESGPQLLKIGPYDDLIDVKTKVVLMKDQWTLLKDTKTGSQRVVKGPTSFIPEPSESATNGTQKAAFIDTDSAVLVLERTSGQQRLVTQRGVFFPEPDETILETRQLIRVLPHEAMVVRDAQGKVTIHNGATAQGSAAFFLPPYTSVVQMMWSDFSHVPKSVGETEAIKKVPVTTIDLRSRKIFFSYEVPTSDNVKLRLDGTIFWKVSNVGKMMNTTSDPEGDVWHHSRSALIQAVSKITLQNFMASFSKITTDAYAIQAADGFYGDRGVTLTSMELTRFEPVEASTAQILQQIIQETINRINRLQVQESSNEVRAASLAAEIELEKQRTALITTKAENAKLEAESVGDAEGLKTMRGAASFIGGLNKSVPDIQQRVQLYSMHQKIKSKNLDTLNLASGNAKLFMTPDDMNLKANSA
jgi:regulator of protease activity HflC (stomatin/prohibitin superfamily)